MSLNNIIKKIAFALILPFTFLIIEIYTLYTCTNSLYCFTISAIPLLPGMLISTFIFQIQSPLLDWIISFIFYFLVGYGLVHLYQKYKS